MKLKEIALELLEKYQEAEETVIWEYSSSIDRHLSELYQECEDYRKLIEEGE